MRKTVLLLALAAVPLAACTENYAKGERVGFVTQFSQAGLMCKTWEGHLNMSQTGMNSSQAFDFSLDGDTPRPHVAAALDSAATQGWKVKLIYHQVSGKNITSCRGETNHFIDSVEVLDRAPLAALNRPSAPAGVMASTGRTIDTVYVVIVGRASERNP